MRVLYADFSPGHAWNGRDPEALEVATATQASVRTASSFLSAGTEALAELPRRIAFLVGGLTPAHAPATATITGIVNEAPDTEAVALPTGSGGGRVAGAVSSSKAFSVIDSIVYSAGSGTAATVAIGFGLAEQVADLRVIVPIETWLEGFCDRSLSYTHLDVGAINEIVVGTSSKINGALGEPTGNYIVPFALSRLGDLARIARDFCLAEAGKVRPNTMQVDYIALRKEAQIDLDKLRKAYAGLGVTPPETPANVGGAIVSTPTCAQPRRPIFARGHWGIF